MRADDVVFHAEERSLPSETVMVRPAHVTQSEPVAVLKLDDATRGTLYALDSQSKVPHGFNAFPQTSQNR